MMNRLLRSCSLIARASLLFIICLLTFFVTCSSFTWLVYAEGSRDLYPTGATGFRANIEWRNSFYGNFLRRRSLFHVFAEAGEVILLGSSAVGVEQGDIRVYNPGTVTGPVGDEIIPGTPDFSCAAQRIETASSAQGQITTRVQELAGPDTITDPATAAPGNDIAEGYVPCFYPATTSGIYHVVFIGPAGDDTDLEIAPTGQIDLTSPDNFNARQGSSVAVWDVTVRSALTSTTDITGRLFVDYLTRFTGGWPRPLFSSYFVLTKDGYLYRTDMQGLDANGFIVYANDVGFLNSDGSPLFQDVVADPSLPGRQQDQLNVLQGGVGLAPPNHLIFINRPSDEAILANSIPLSPRQPVLNSIEFQGRLGENDTFVGGGGIFTFTSNISGVFRLIISRNGIDFAPQNPLNRVIRDDHFLGSQTIVWDGLDNAGNPFPAGLDYKARFHVGGGEYHFPILDAEDSLVGGPSYEMLNPPGGVCPTFNGRAPNCNIGFYDDRGYTAANGTNVGTPGVVLPGNDPPNPPNSDLLSGYDTTIDQRRFGNGTGTGFGDKKGLDLWTYFPSETKFTSIDIFAINVAIAKTDGDITTRPGGSVTYKLDYTNTTLVDATGVVITEVVPLHTSFDATSSAPTGWSCPDGSPSGTVCTTAVGPLPAGASGSVNFGVIVDDPVPNNVSQIENTALIGEDGAHGPEPLGDNTASDNTPLSFPVSATPTPPEKTPDSTATPRIKTTPTQPSDITPGPTQKPTITATSTQRVLILPETGLRNSQTGPKMVKPLMLLAGLSLCLFLFHIWRK